MPIGLRIGIGIDGRLGAASAGGGGSVADGGLKSFTVVDDTPLDVNADDIGINGSGWVAKVVLKGITDTGGTVDPSKLLFTLSDPGFDATGAATTVTRTGTGRAFLRRQAPNGNSPQISTDGTDLTIMMALSEWVYAGSTIVSASIDDGFYDGSVASGAASKANNSVTDYTRPTFAWINTQMDSCGDTVDVEAVAFHRHAMNGQQVACVKYTASDGTHTGTTATAGAPQLSSLQTQGNIAEVYAATVDASTMTQGAVFQVNATIYPWIGEAYTPSLSWPTAAPATPLNVLSDRTGGYGGAYAYVSPNGNDGTGVVSADPATAQASPYLSIATAAPALQAWNNANRGHNNVGGATLRLMDDAGSDYTWDIGGGYGAITAGLTWFNIEADPDNAGTATISSSGFGQAPHLTRYRNAGLHIEGGSYPALGPGANAHNMVAFDGITMACNPAWWDLYSYRNVAFTGDSNLANLIDTNTEIISVIGCTLPTTSTALYNTTLPNVFIGNDNIQNVGYYTSSDRPSGQSDVICYNNSRLAGTYNYANAGKTVEAITFVQNFCEDLTAGSGVIFTILADGDDTTCLNIIETHNSLLGGRGNRCYNDEAADQVAPSGVQKIITSLYNIWDNWNCKTDRLNGGDGSVGNWASCYNVGNHGNVSLFGSRSGIAPSNDESESYLGMAWPDDSYYYLKGQESLSDAALEALFTDYRVQPEATPTTGGDYHPVNGASYLTGRVPAGKGALKYDIAGSLRATDGTGAAGAYEQAA